MRHRKKLPTILSRVSFSEPIAYRIKKGKLPIPYREKVKGRERNKSPSTKKEKAKAVNESQTDVLIRLGREAKLFSDELSDAYAAVAVDAHTELWKVSSRTYKLWLIRKFFEETGKAPNVDSMNQALGVMEARALFDGEQKKLQLRVAGNSDTIYYDLADKEWRAVEITKKGCKILTNPPPLFVRNKNSRMQVKPDFSGDMRLLLKHVAIPNEEDRILYLVYIVSCLIPDIPHPILVLCGEKGAAKSTAMKMTRSIVDPAVRALLTMPNSIQDTSLCLANNYMPVFDNMDGLSAEKSDLLCIASTGGGISRRTLYTNEDETILELRRCVGMNGINVVVNRADLLDRSIILELKRIDNTMRKEERQVWEEFEADRAQIVGGAMTALSKAMSIYPDVKLDKLHRMADFTRWGYAIAEALGYGGEAFLKAYEDNQGKSNEEAISSHPVAASIIALMESRYHWSGSVAELLETLEQVARRVRINTHVKVWPAATHVLSRRLREVQSNLEQSGIFFDIRNTGQNKTITLTKRKQ